jgi:hypothetical protein
LEIINYWYEVKLGWIKSQPSQWWQISPDGGAHWEPFVKGDSFNLSFLKPNMLTLSNGSIIGWEDGWNKNTAYDGHPGESVRHTIICASSMEELIKGNIKQRGSNFFTVYGSVDE